MKIKLGRFLSTGAKEHVWVEFSGEGVGESVYFSSSYDAGEYVGNCLRLKKGPEIEFDEISFNYKSGGVEIPPDFVGPNYISLFWGDRDRLWIRDLSDYEKRRFEHGVEEGLTPSADNWFDVLFGERRMVHILNRIFIRNSKKTA